MVLSLGQPPIRIIPYAKPTPLEYQGRPKHPSLPGHLCASAVCRPFMGPINSMLHLTDQKCLARFESQSSGLSSTVVPAHNLILIVLTAETTEQSTIGRCQAIWLCTQLITWAKGFRTTLYTQLLQNAPRENVVPLNGTLVGNRNFIDSNRFYVYIL